MTFFEQSVFFGVSVSLAAYGIGVLLQKKFKFALFNPLLISVVLTIAVLLTAHISYDTFYEGAKYLSYLLTPATVCLAVPLYEKLSLLKSNWKAIFAGILSGVITTLCSVFVMSKLFHLTHEEYVTLLPKSITTAIGMGVSEELGGYVTLTVAMIIITGIFGNVIAVSVCRLFHITDPIAKGVSIGSAAHALGTAKALEIGEVEGAMSSLSIVVAQTSCEKRSIRKNAPFFARLPRGARRRAEEPEEHSGRSLRLLLRRFLYEKVFAHPRARAADVLDPRFSGRLRRAGQGPRRRERHRRQREGGPARGAHGVPAVYRLSAHAQRAFLHQRGPSGSETVRNFNR